MSRLAFYRGEWLMTMEKKIQQYLIKIQRISVISVDIEIIVFQSNNFSHFSSTQEFK
jgi:hypothetical protein